MAYHVVEEAFGTSSAVKSQEDVVVETAAGDHLAYPSEEETADFEVRIEV